MIAPDGRLLGSLEIPLAAGRIAIRGGRLALTTELDGAPTVDDMLAPFCPGASAWRSRRCRPGSAQTRTKLAPIRADGVATRPPPHSPGDRRPGAAAPPYAIP